MSMSIFVLLLLLLILLLWLLFSLTTFSRLEFRQKLGILEQFFRKFAVQTFTAKVTVIVVC